MSEVNVLSRRERHKDQRRARIIDAAHALLREVGADDLSVKSIADRADVSPATVYNLFASKGAVLAKVYDNDFEGFVAKLEAAAPPNALDAAFESVRIVANLYREDPGFYRGMSIQNPRAEPELVMAVQEPRRTFWLSLLGRAVAQGDLAQGTRIDLLAMTILELGGGAFQYWRADLITIADLERQTAYGIARLLLGVASPAGRRKLEARIAAIEDATVPDQTSPAASAA